MNNKHPWLVFWGILGVVLFIIFSMYVLYLSNYRALYSVHPQLAQATCNSDLYDFGRDSSERECSALNDYMAVELSSCEDCDPLPAITDECFYKLEIEEQNYLNGVDENGDRIVRSFPTMNESFWYLQDNCYLLK